MYKRQVYVTHDQEEALSLSDRIVVMSEGRIEQIGTPFEIYNFPTTGFVARFVGTLNVLSGTVIDPAAGTIQAAGQSIMTGSPIHDAHVGDPVTIAVRPEMISMGAIEGMNQMTGVIDDVTFLGAVVRVRIRHTDGSGALSFDTFNNPNLAVPAHGTAITISYPTAACLVIDKAQIAAGAAAATEEAGAA